MNELAVKLSEEAWQRVLQILATAPWQTANPLILAIGEQLRREAAAKGVVGDTVKRDGDARLDA